MGVAYFDCFSGIAGDMVLGALIHAGLSEAALRAELAKLELDEYTLRIEKVWRDAMEGMRVDVEVDAGRELPHRGLKDIRAILERSTLDPVVKRRATDVFTRLAQAEGKVHGCSPEEVHFHEVGATDAIVDIVGAVAGLHLLGIDRVLVGPITEGCGTQRCAHGEMPVPVPAVVELMTGFELKLSRLHGELVTPTGAALLAALATPTTSVSLVPRSVGYGFGARTRKDGPPNALRVVLADAPRQDETLMLLETNLDDASGQVVGHALSRALEVGALDAFSIATQAKKSRPGLLLTVLVDEAHVDVVERMLYAETTTLGVRRQRVERTKLERRQVVVETSLGAVRVKYVRGAGVTRGAAECDDVAKLATTHRIAFHDAQRRIQAELPQWPSD
ncbi:MAG: nickel pincer cofactor biosynthesis protein LarC [Planctomycetes bacterium]|nr:nickel pincer cofactor biosynthesis protein LarC [Planctomycetota bacterium]MCC7171757.1 nickel pincer cofactor biosynthesis protein LarC [Planctomycetota bacterium]